MVDSLNSPQTEQPVPGVSAETTEPHGGGASFLATTVGKLVVGGIALVLILGAIAAILVLFVFNGAPEDDGAVVAPPVTVTDSTSTASVETSPEVRPADDWADTFVFRNVFEPTVKVTLTPLPEDSQEESDTDTADLDIPADTLFLSSTSTVDGVPVANLIWNGTTYTLEEGESIPDTPWEVLSISGDTVVMLYGDARVTLTVGQGLSK